MGALAGWTVYHADDDLTAEMALALEQHRPFTNAMRDHFFTIITKNILDLQSKHDKLVVTQAVYKNRHREYLLSQIPNMEMILVDADDVLILQRIKVRQVGVSAQNSAALRRDFEYPDTPTRVIVNDSDQAHIVQQLNKFYASGID